MRGLNWNCNLAEIASELIDGGIKPRTKEFKQFAEALKEFFNASERDVEMVENMLDVFGGFLMASFNLFALHHEITGDDGTSRKLVTVIDGNSIRRS